MDEALCHYMAPNVRAQPREARDRSKLAEPRAAKRVVLRRTQPGRCLTPVEKRGQAHIGHQLDSRGAVGWKSNRSNPR